MKDSLSKDNELIELQELQERIKKLQLDVRKATPLGVGWITKNVYETY